MSPRVLLRDSSCPNGGIFYSCNTGFVGCCLVEACNPGVGCPAGKDMTLENSSSVDSSTPTTPVSSTISSAPTSPMSSTNGVAPSNASSFVATSTSSAASSVTQATTARLPSSITAPGPGNQQTSIDATPTAAIVGGVLGGIILIAIFLGLFLCYRRRKGTKVYNAAVYPSPHVGSDMSPQLSEYEKPKVSTFVQLMRTKQKSAHHLNSTEIVQTAELGEALPRHLTYAELPAGNENVRNI